jgi:hypothetical protein
VTAINIIRQRDAVHVLTDGASYEPDGTPGWPGEKIWPLPHLHAVVAVSGLRLMPGIAVELLSKAADTYDGLKEKAADVVREIDTDFRPFADAFAMGETPLAIVVAGFGAAGPDSYVVANHGRYPGISPFTVTTTGPIAIMPEIDVQAWADSIGRTIAGADDLDPAVDGLKLLEIQRATPVPVLGNESVQAKIVGSFAQITTVRRDGEIRTCVLKRWDDEAGTKIAANEAA